MLARHILRVFPIVSCSSAIVVYHTPSSSLASIVSDTKLGLQCTYW